MNQVGIKKWLSLMLIFAIPILAGLLTRLFVPVKDIFTPLIVSGVSGFIMVVIANFMLNTPFRQAEEGSGLAVLNLNSTGLITMFIAKINLPLLVIKDKAKEYSTKFTQSILFDIAAPQPADYAEDDNYVYLRLPKSLWKASVFQISSMKCLIWNDNMKAFLTKESLSKIESSTIVDHMILYLNHKTEEIGAYVRDFARYVVIQFKPQGKGLFGSPMILIIIIVIVIIVVAVLLGPTIIKIFTQGAGNLMSSGVTKAAGAITPVAGK